MKSLILYLTLCGIAAGQLTPTFKPAGSNGEQVNASPFITALGGTTAGKALFQIPSIGTDVVTALQLPIGTNGAMQRQGDPLTPTSIIVPDVSGIIPASGSIGLKRGSLSVGDGVTTGGNEINPLRRIRGSYRFDTAGQPITGAFARIAALPIFASDSPATSATSSFPFKIFGTIRMTDVGAGYSTLTKEAGVGFCFNNDSLTAKTAGKWLYVSMHPAPGTGKNIFVSEGVINWNNSFLKYPSFPSYAVGASPRLYSNSSVYSTGSDPVLSNPFMASGGDGNQRITAGVENKMWLMVYAEKVTGQPTGGYFDIQYDLTLEFP